MRTGRGVVTLQILGLKDGFLTGKSDYLGAVKMTSKAIQRIELNIYAVPKAAAHSTAPSSARPGMHRGVQMLERNIHIQEGQIHIEGGIFRK